MQSPLRHAFAHRDDEHPNPLWDALTAGFRHLELDVWQLFGRLLVAHDPQDLRPGRTFQRLYLHPLARGYAEGRLGADDPVWLYLDVKTAARPAHRAIERAAREASRWIARPAVPDDDAPIRLVLTGNRPPLEPLVSAPEGRCHYDGRLSDLDVERDVERDARWMPTVSADWSRFSRWRGEGPIPLGDLERLRTAVAATRGADQKLRFWATPDRSGPARERVWSTLLEEGVELLNSDDLHGLATFLTARQRGAPDRSSSSA